MKIKKSFILFAAAMLICLSGCGNRSGSVVTGQYYYPDKNDEKDGENAEAAQEEPTEQEERTSLLSTDQFMILSNDMQEECLILEQLASGKEYIYYYSIVTRFLDKYGNRANVAYFEPGRVVTIGEKDSFGRITQVQISDAVWEYQDVKKYSVDEQRGIFRIAGERYSFDADLFISTGETTCRISDLTDMDTIRVIGVGKELISIAVTTGHGELQLANTELFEGSFIQIGSKIFAEVTPDMLLEIPEGTYTVTVANNGYGGSKEITIESGERQSLDLDTLKGEGPKIGNILFAVDVEGAILQIDGEVMDYSEAVPLQYGVHTLTVTANSYEEYSKKLFVNSEEATIVIGLSGDSSAVGTTAGSTAETSSEEENDGEAEETVTPGSLSGSIAGSMTGGANTAAETDTVTDAGIDAVTGADTSTNTSADYLSTLSELLSSLNSESE